MYVIGVDLGTQSMKGFLVDAQGKFVAESSAAYDPVYPFPAWTEENPADWIHAFKKIVRDLMETSGVAPEEVGTIAMDAINDTVVAIDKEGNPLMPAIIWCDRRAEAETAEVGTRVDPQHVFEVTGLNLDSSHTAAKMLWIKKNRPDVFEKTAYMLNAASFMVYWMTGEAVVDYAQASASMLYNVANKCWDEEMAKIFDLDPNLLGVIKDPHEIAGTLTEYAASELGLTTATKVAVSTGDEHSACVGAGLVKPGMVCNITGTAEPVAAVADKPMLDTISGLVETHHHADSRWWLIENPGFLSGGATRWYRDTLLKIDDYNVMTLLASKSPIGSNGVIFLPCMQGAMTPTWNL